MQLHAIINQNRHCIGNSWEGGGGGGAPPNCGEGGKRVGLG